MDLLNKINNMPKHYRLCEKHFEEKCKSTKTSSRKRLLPDAVPTIFVHRVKREMIEVEPEIIKTEPEIIKTEPEIIKTEPEIIKTEPKL
nr:unnamed protein product [Callosobruchus analis]